MKFRLQLTPVLFSGILAFSYSCNTETEMESSSPGPSEPDKFNEYWYAGEAEISSYDLSQVRYGEIREGSAVMIFVTEPYSNTYHTKADSDEETDQTVMKLNFTKNFITGIYPYSIMTSVFYPIESNDGAVKLNNSTQEWCGQTYMELIKEGDFDISIQSYFQGESKDHKHEYITNLEDEIWTMIKVRPDQLPEGEINMIPSFSYLRLMHKETKPYMCKCEKTVIGDTTIYNMSYQELKREMQISYQTDFPHQIYGWEESYPCSKCDAEEPLTSNGTLKNVIKADYWNENSVSDTLSRFQLGLH